MRGILFPGLVALMGLAWPLHARSQSMSVAVSPLVGYLSFTEVFHAEIGVDRFGSWRGLRIAPEPQRVVGGRLALGFGDSDWSLFADVGVSRGNPGIGDCLGSQETQCAGRAGSMTMTRVAAGAMRRLIDAPGISVRFGAGPSLSFVKARSGQGTARMTNPGVFGGAALDFPVRGRFSLQLSAFDTYSRLDADQVAQLATRFPDDLALEARDRPWSHAFVLGAGLTIRLRGRTSSWR
jgi:hypothetical protein